MPSKKSLEIKRQSKKTCSSLSLFHKKSHRKVPVPRLGFVSFPVFLSASNPSFWKDYNVSERAVFKVKKSLDTAIRNGKRLIETGSFNVELNNDIFEFDIHDLQSHISDVIKKNVQMKIYHSLALIGMIKAMLITYNKIIKTPNIVPKDMHRIVNEFYLPIVFLDEKSVSPIAVITDLNFIILPIWTKYFKHIVSEYNFAVSKITHVFNNYSVLRYKYFIHMGFTNINRASVPRKKVRKLPKQCEICGNDIEGSLSIHHIIPLGVLSILGFNVREKRYDADNQIMMCNVAHNHNGGIEKIISFNEMFTHFEIEKPLYKFRMFYFDYAILMSRYFLFSRLLLRNEVNLLNDILNDEFRELIKLGRYLRNLINDIGMKKDVNLSGLYLTLKLQNTSIE